MIEPKRTTRKANREDISAIFAFAGESMKTGRTEFIRRAVDSGDAHLLEEEGKVVAVGVLEYTFFEYGFISLVFVDPEERRAADDVLVEKYAEKFGVKQEFARSSPFWELSIEPQACIEMAEAFSMLRAGVLQSILLTYPGCVKGLRLIDGDSLDRYLEGLANKEFTPSPCKRGKGLGRPKRSQMVQMGNLPRHDKCL